MYWIFFSELLYSNDPSWHAKKVDLTWFILTTLVIQNYKCHKSTLRIKPLSRLLHVLGIKPMAAIIRNQADVHSRRFKRSSYMVINWVKDIWEDELNSFYIYFNTQNNFDHNIKIRIKEMNSNSLIKISCSKF